MSPANGNTSPAFEPVSEARFALTPVALVYLSRARRAAPVRRYRK